MRRRILLALVALAASAGIMDSARAGAGHDRRQDRREAIVAGSVRNKVATERAENRYQECVKGSGYDENCARQRYRDEQDAKKKGRRTAVIVGAQ